MILKMSIKYTVYSHLFQISVFSECNASVLVVEWWRIELAHRLAESGRHLSLLVWSCSPSLLLDCLIAEDWLASCPQLQHAFIEGNKVMMWPRTGRWCWNLWREVCNYFWQQWLCTSKISSILAPRLSIGGVLRLAKRQQIFSGYFSAGIMSS